MINQQINQLKRDNFIVLPVNDRRYESPFLLSSGVDAINTWSNHVAEAPDRAVVKQKKRKTAIGSGKLDYDIATILQSSVYDDADKRPEIRGLQRIPHLDDNENTVYLTPDGTKAFIGFRGTTNMKDVAADSYLLEKYVGDGIDKALGYYDPNNEKDYLPGYDSWNERRDDTLAKIALVRQEFPYVTSAVISGHSAGGSLVKSVLSEMPDDDNFKLKGYTYNSWLDPSFNDDKDPRLTSQNTFGDPVSLKEQIGNYHTVDLRSSKLALTELATLGSTKLASSLIKGKIIDDPLQTYIASNHNLERASFIRDVGEGNDPALAYDIHLIKTTEGVGQLEALDRLQQHYDRPFQLNNLEEFSDFSKDHFYIGLKDAADRGDTEINSFDILEADNYIDAEAAKMGLSSRIFINTYRGTPEEMKEARLDADEDFRDFIADAENPEMAAEIDAIAAKTGLARTLVKGLGYFQRANEIALGAEVIQAVHSSDNFKPSDSGLSELEPVKARMNNLIKIHKRAWEIKKQGYN